MATTHRTPARGVPLSPLEAMLEDLHAAQLVGDVERAASLEASIEADLCARERVLGIGGLR